MVTTRSPHVTHARVAHNPQPRHSVLQLAASHHHIAMAAAKRAAEAAAAAAAKKAHKEPAAPSAAAPKEDGEATVPVGKPVGLERHAEAASVAAGSGAGRHAGTMAVLRPPFVIRFPDNEAAAKALGGEHLRALMEAVADDVGKLLRGCFQSATVPAMLAQFAGVDTPAAHPPLDLPSGPLGSMKLSSYKDPWCDDKAARSLGETGMYEAAANIMWLHAFCSANPISGDPPTWLTVVEIKDKEMVAAARAQLSVRSDVPRIVFPITAPALVVSTNAAKQTTNSSCSTAEHRFLRVLSGEAYVWAWYLAMWEALSHLQGHYLGGSALAVRFDSDGARPGQLDQSTAGIVEHGMVGDEQGQGAVVLRFFPGVCTEGIGGLRRHPRREGHEAVARR